MKSIYKVLSSGVLVFMLAMTATFSNAQTIVSGIKAGTPFITTSAKAKAVLSYGKGILKAPAEAKKAITFGSARTGGFAADGVNANFDTSQAKGEWIEFAISPASGYNLNITGITLTGDGTVASPTNNYAVAFAIDDTTMFANGTCTFIDSANGNGSVLYRTSGYLASGADTTGQNLTVNNGSTVYLRIYVWNASARASTSVFTINNFVISGTTSTSQTTFSSTYDTICNGSSYFFNGTSYNTPGIYPYSNLTNSVGADSTATLYLTVTPPATTKAIDLVGCTVTYKGVTYTSSTVLTDTVRSARGCDSIYNVVTINVNCNPIINSFTPTETYSGDTVTISGLNFTSAKAVSFGGTPASAFVIIGDTTIKAVVANGSSGSISISNAEGVGSVDGFVFNPANIIEGTKNKRPFITAGTNVVATLTTGSGIKKAPAYAAGNITFGTAANGGFAANSATATFDTAYAYNQYVQFAIAPALGYNMNINGITITGMGTAASATNTYAIAYAVGDTSLFGSGGATFLDTAGNAGNTLYRSNGYLVSGADTSGQSITVNDGSALYVRVYLWGASARASASVFTITNFSAIGTITTDSSSSVTRDTICAGGSFLFNDSIYTKTGTYTVHLQSAEGGDSTAILRLKVNAPATMDTLTYVNCTSVTYNGIAYTSSTSFVDTVRSLFGCDSIYHNVNINISCNPYISSFAPTNAAIGDTVTISGFNLTGTSAVTFGGTPAASFIVVGDTTILAIVGNGATGTLSITTPNGVDTASGFVYNTANIITGIKAATPFITAGKNVAAALTYGAGILEVPASAKKNITFGTRGGAARTAGFAADGATANFDTAQLKGEWVEFAIKPASGYKLNINGITLKGNGTVASTTNYYAVAYSVGDTTAFANGKSTFLDSAGNAGNLLNTANGYLVSGDDTTGQSILVNNNSALYIRVYLWNKSTKTTTSQFTITNFTVYGSVTAAMPTSSTTDTSICAGTSFTFNGVSYDSAGTYKANLTNSVGADSTATLVLTLKNTSTSTTIDSICAGSSYTFNGVSYTKAGTYVVHLTNAAGCDSTATLVLTVVAPPAVKITANLITPGNPCPPVAYYQFNSTITNGEEVVLYQWIFGSDTMPTTTSYPIMSSYDVPGKYWVSCTVTNSLGCKSATDSVLVTIFPDSISSVSISSQVNGTTETFTATAISGGSTPTYQWYKNNTLVGSDSTYTDSVLVTGDSVWVVMTSSAGCIIQPNDTSNIIIVTNPLPVSIKAFTVSIDGNHSVLNWATATELNTSHFNVQHSTDGSNFSNIGNVKAIGNGANSYQFTDKSPANGTNYYRLQSVDKDGSYTYSKVVSALFTINNSPLTIYPNPAKDNITINGNHIASIQVLDNMGRLVSVQSVKDATNPSIAVASLPAGVYHLRIQTTDGSMNTIAFIKE